jgi:hypothetical protein
VRAARATRRPPGGCNETDDRPLLSDPSGVGSSRIDLLRPRHACRSCGSRVAPPWRIECAVPVPDNLGNVDGSRMARALRVTGDPMKPALASAVCPPPQVGTTPRRMSIVNPWRHWTESDATSHNEYSSTPAYAASHDAVPLPLVDLPWSDVTRQGESRRTRVNASAPCRASLPE